METGEFKRRPTGVDLVPVDLAAGGLDLQGGAGDPPVAAVVRGAELLPQFKTLKEQAIALEAWETDPWTAVRILDVEKLIGPVVDPCCGTGILSRAALNAGYDVTALDIANWGYGGQTFQADFLASKRRWTLPAGPFTVFLNPPFQRASEFIRRALDLGAEKIVCFQRFAFVESGEREVFWRETPPSKIWLCGTRANCHLFTTPPAERVSRSGANAWFVWQKGRPPEPMGILYKQGETNWH